MNKKVLSTVLVLSLVFTSGTFAATKNRLTTTKIPEVMTKEASQTSELTPEQLKRNQGYIKKTTMGIEYKRDSALWKQYDDNIDVNGPEDSDSEDNSKPIFDGLYYGYISNDLLKQYEQATQIKDEKEKESKITEIFSKEKNLYSIIIYRKDKLPGEDQIKKDVKGENKVKLGEVEGYVFYFGYDNYKDSDLSSDADKKAFKALYDDTMVIKDTIKVFKPVTSQEGIMNLKKLQFNLKDINGNPVSDSIFKQNKLTMVNVWGTYCGPCIRELPTLQKLSVELKAKKVGIVGIVSDVYTSSGVDKTLVEKGKGILGKAGVKYTNIIPDDTMKYDGVLSFISGIPTSFFVDSKGNIVGEIRIGDGTKEEYIKLIDSILVKIK